MRLVDQVRGATLLSESEECAAETARSAASSGTTCDRPLAWQCHDAGSLGAPHPASEGPASGNGSPRVRSEPDASRHPIATAMSWLLAQLIAGFAACGEAMYPGFAVPAEFIDGQEPEWNSQPHRWAQHERGDEVPWLNASNPWMSGDPERSATPGWSARLTSPVARFWSRMRYERRVRLTIAKLEELDDQTLKNIEIHRSQAASVARHGDRYEP